MSTPPGEGPRTTRAGASVAVPTAPVVSVIIPCYNAGPWLAQTLASVRAQTHSLLDVLVVDDGSDDAGTLRQLAMSADDRIRVVRQRNAGLASARNRGVREAKGTYLQFLDADDLLDPPKIASQVAILEADPTLDLVVCDYEFTDADGSERRSHPGSSPRLSEPMLEAVLFRWERGLSIPIHCALFRRSLWAGADPFESGMRAKEDWVFWAMTTMGGRRAAYQDEPLALYRIHDRGLCASAAGSLRALCEAALLLSERIPSNLREPFLRETLRHLRTTYAASLDDPAAFRPLRHRLVDSVWRVGRRIPGAASVGELLRKALSGRD